MGALANTGILDDKGPEERLLWRSVTVMGIVGRDNLIQSSSRPLERRWEKHKLVPRCFFFLPEQRDPRKEFVSLKKKAETGENGYQAIFGSASELQPTTISLLEPLTSWRQSHRSLLAGTCGILSVEASISRHPKCGEMVTLGPN